MVNGSASPTRAVFSEKVAVRYGLRLARMFLGPGQCCWSTSPLLGMAQLSALLDESRETSQQQCLGAAAPQSTSARPKAASGACSAGDCTRAKTP